MIGGTAPAAVTGTAITGTSFATTGDMSFGDNDKAIFGAGSDLQIYHDGSGSYVDDQGTGGLIMRGTNLFLRSSTNENYIGCIADGTVTLYYDQNPKLATTATGVDVTGTVTATEFNIGEFATSTNVLQSNTGGTGARLRASVSSAAFPTFSFSDDDNTGVFHPTADALAFSTAGAEAMRITADGSVGIGTSSPSVDLHLASGFPAIKLDNTDAGGDAWRIASGDTGSGFAGKLQIYNEDTAVVAMVLDASGNVGIGTAAPTQKLDVSGNARLVGSDPYLQALRTSDFYYGQLSAEGFSAFTNANAPAPITFKTATNERMRITADGDVGIGTAVPVGKLDVGATSDPVLTLRNTATGGGYVGGEELGKLSWHTDDTSGIGAHEVSYVKTTNTKNGTTPNGELVFGTSVFNAVPTEKMRIDASGNVGIGTASPDFPLDVAGAMKTKAAGVLVSENYSATNDVGKFYDNAGALTIESQIFGNANAASAPIVFRTSSVADGRAERMRITADGNVGIGTANPLDDLHIASSIPTIRLEDTAGTSSYGTMRYIDGRLLLESDRSNVVGSSTIEMSVDGSEAMRIDSSGTVILKGPDDNSLQFYEAGSEIARIGPNGGDLRFLVGSTTTPSMVIDSGGNVLVGTDTHYAGKIYMRPAAANEIGVGYRPMTAIAYNPSSFFNTSGSSIGGITCTTTATAYNTSSDYRLKEDWVPMSGASERVQALKPINFAWKVDGSRVDGFLAHEAQAVVPECATGTKDAMKDEEYEVTAAVYEDIIVPAVEAVAEVPAVYDDAGALVSESIPAVEAEAERTEQNLVTEAVMGTRSVPDMQGIDQSKLVPLLTAALQEALTKIDALEARLTALEAV